MSEVREDTNGKTRDLPIKAELRDLLLGAAEACGVDIVRVTSGGQCRIGTCAKRTGSQRHDEGNAADLQLLVGGRTLKFTDAGSLGTFEGFVTEAARLGATGVGAGLDYMGADTIHVGFGSRAVWGAGGKSANAPAWIRSAAKAGWDQAGVPMLWQEGESLDSDDEEIEEDQERIGAVLDEMYDMISGPAGPRDWSRQLNSFLPEARQVRTWVDEQGRPQAKMMGLDEYAANVAPFFAENDFYEIETARRIDVFGNMAHAWSHYEARRSPDDSDVERRGINSIQLFRHPELGWRIVHMIWDNER